MSCEVSPTETVCMDCQTFFFFCFLFCGGWGGVNILTLNLFHSLGYFSSKNNWPYLLIFPQKIGIDISYKLFAMEMLCMKCQTISFLGVGVIFDP